MTDSRVDPSVSTPEPLSTPPIAAVDLGSNSFHMIVATQHDGQLRVLDRLRDPVRLAAGLDANHRIDPEVRKRAIECLQRFGQRLRDLGPERVRVVGTNTLRQARDPDFLDAAQQALGHPIEVVAGVEEARLIYLGVAHSMADSGGRRLVMDIGGGSTELIIGEGFQTLRMDSLYMGCVNMSERFFRGGKLGKTNFVDAELYAGQELEPIQERFRRLGWQMAAGASGTIRTVSELLVEAGWAEQGLNLPGLRKLRKVLIDAGTIDKFKSKTLSDDRRSVLAGGVAILNATFEALNIERMQIAQGALREGLLYDLLGRIQHADVREAAVQAMAGRYQVDTAHAARIEAVALHLLEQLAPAWGLAHPMYPIWLHWAAALHEVGLVIAHSQYHRHGAYLVQHSDLAGFSVRDQSLLAVLVRGHRRKPPREELAALPKVLEEPARKLIVLLRLAVLLRRDRADVPMPAVTAKAGGNQLALRFPEGWLEAHPLTHADLAEERKYLEAFNLDLKFV
jgi:exopolyphosphatase / guanosine-5'-triphosphate,3'-diphosphate pyrophosphatase